jgi:beta-glucosidase/6-phospho-beta-glucosidase/beta-galactosidase
MLGFVNEFKVIFLAKTFTQFLQFQHYRFSMSWSRFFPVSPRLNERAFDYYNKLINELIANNIEPVVTLVHYDLPNWIQEEGGYLNSNFVKYFKLYADEIFKRFGSRVKVWITFNEPTDTCVGNFGEYVCSYNILLAHATAYHLYKDRYAAEQKGMIGITLDGRFYYPKDSSVPDDVVQRALAFDIGWFSHPIFSKIGGYPQVMVDEVNERSKRQKLPWSRLPVMDEDTKNFIRGSADFLGYNYYSSRLVQLDSSDYDPDAPPNWSSDSKILFFTDPKWKQAKSSWLFSVPEGLHDALVWFKNEYENPTILITENGWSDYGELEDDGRIEYLKSHLSSISKAINEDN